MALCGSGGGYPPGATIAASIVQLAPCDDACGPLLSIITMRSGSEIYLSQSRDGVLLAIIFIET